MRPGTFVSILFAAVILLAAGAALRGRAQPAPGAGQPHPQAFTPQPPGPAVPSPQRPDSGAPPSDSTQPASTTAPKPTTSLETRLDAQRKLAAGHADKLALDEAVRDRFVDDYMTYARPILESDRAAIGTAAYRALIEREGVALESRLRAYLTDEQLAVTRRMLGR